MPSGVYERKDVFTRFWSRVNKIGTLHHDLGHCWDYGEPGHYHHIGVNYTPILVHRLSWMIFHGFDPGPLYICHACDNPSCVNPEHLFIGTQKDNISDCVSKGRLNPGRPDNRGERNGMSVLTNAAVADIRKNMVKRSVGNTSAAYFAAKYGVTVETVRKIKSGHKRKNG